MAFDNATVVDVGEIVCREQRFAVMTAEGVVGFRDDKHVADRLVRSLATLVAQLLTAAGN